MSSKHRDPCSSPSLQGPPTPRRSGPHRPRPSSQEATTPRRSGPPGGPNLIVARGLYEVLEQERQGNQTPRRRSNPKAGGQASRPNFLFCYLCGLQFSSTSLPIHQPQCYVKKLIEWERADPLKRGPKPLDPETREEKMKQLSVGGTGGNKLKGKELDLFNEMQIEHFNTNMLLKCENCGRTFLPDRLEVHQRSCKPGSAGASKPLPRTSSDSTTSKISKEKKQNVSPAKSSIKKSPGIVPLDEKVVGVQATSVNRTTRRLSTSESSNKFGSNLESCRSSSIGEKDPLMETQPGKEVMSPNIDTNTTPIPIPHTTTTTTPNKNKNNNNKISTAAIPTYQNNTESSLVLSPVENVQKTIKIEKEHIDSKPLSREVSISLKESRESSKINNNRIETKIEEIIKSPSKDNELIINTEASESRESLPQNDEDGNPEKPVTKIRLNNVSRFKNVQSRIKVELHKQEELPRCRYCNRTFNVDRLSKHEDVCLERNKPPQKSTTPSVNTTNLTPRSGASVSLSATATPPAGLGLNKNKLKEQTRETRTNLTSKLQQPTVTADTTTAITTTTTAAAKTTTTTTTATTPTTSSTGGNNMAREGSLSSDTQTKGSSEKSGQSGTVKLRFCFECGVKLRGEPQKFCAECGTKLLP